MKYSQELLQNTGLKEKERQIKKQIKDEERRIVDLNVRQLEMMEKESKIK